MKDQSSDKSTAMKIHQIYSDKEGVLRACIEPVPVEPDYMNHKYWIHDPQHPKMIPGLYDEDMVKYRKALQHCKDSSVPFEDQAHARHDICYALKNFANNAIQPDTFYPCEVEVEIIQICDEPDCIVEDSVLHQRVARLSSVAPEPSFKEKPEPDWLKMEDDLFGDMADNASFVDGCRKVWNDYVIPLQKEIEELRKKENN